MVVCVDNVVFVVDIAAGVVLDVSDGGLDVWGGGMGVATGGGVDVSTGGGVRPEGGAESAITVYKIATFIIYCFAWNTRRIIVVRFSVTYELCWTADTALQKNIEDVPCFCYAFSIAIDLLELAGILPFILRIVRRKKNVV